jgi:hypothetical protein|tara:strand:+ start:418 stop:681 length:264 start_codon:yes stop_codon:yes gene_type:complete
MKNWINFSNIKNHTYDNEKNKHVTCKPYHVDSLGSFGNITFDGRYSLNTLIELSFKYMENNRYDGFKIYSGEWLKENNLIYKHENNE